MSMFWSDIARGAVSPTALAHGAREPPRASAANQTRLLWFSCEFSGRSSTTRFGVGRCWLTSMRAGSTSPRYVMRIPTCCARRNSTVGGARSRAQSAGKNSSRWFPGSTATASVRWRARPVRPRNWFAWPRAARSSPCTSSRCAGAAVGIISCSPTYSEQPRRRHGGVPVPGPTGVLSPNSVRRIVCMVICHLDDMRSPRVSVPAMSTTAPRPAVRYELWRSCQ